jgi:hypothetical protein
VLVERLGRAARDGARSKAIDADEVIHLTAQQLGDPSVLRSVRDPVVEVVVARLLVVGFAGFERLVVAVPLEHNPDGRDLAVGHPLGCQAAGHPLQRLTDVEHLEQVVDGQRDHPRTDVRDDLEEPTALEPPDRLP